MAAALLALGTLTGCVANGTPGNAGALRYLALGDSYTIGEGVAEDDRWPLQLARALRAEGIALGDPRIIATTGWTTDELSAAMDAGLVEAAGGIAPGAPPRSYDFVSLLIGVNNQYRGRSLDNYRAEFDALLERAIGLAGGDAGRVLVLSIPDWGVTRFGRESRRDTGAISRELDAYNAAAHATCDARGVAFVDITAASRAHGAEATMQAEDGLHPSAAMYALWTRLALPVAQRLLAAR
jgi:lysophospholipase L1-like esterase